MQAYFQDIINLDISIEKGGKEKPKHKKNKINRNELQNYKRHQFARSGST